MENFSYNHRLNRFDKFPTRSELKRKAISECQILSDSGIYDLDLGMIENSPNTVFLKETENGNYFFTAHKNIGCSAPTFSGYCKKSGEYLDYRDEEEIDFVNTWAKPWIEVSKDNFSIYNLHGRYDIKITHIANTPCWYGIVDFLISGRIRRNRNVNRVIDFIMGMSRKLNGDTAMDLLLGTKQLDNMYKLLDKTVFEQISRESLNQIYDYGFGYEILKKEEWKGSKIVY